MSSLIPEDLTQPGTHALVIGVSEYLHLVDGKDPTPTGISFGMEQLSAAARSASEFAAWLLNEYQCDHAPLRSLRVLLSPADGEEINPDIAALLPVDSSATTNNVRIDLGEFRHACDASVDNIAIVYIAGHGVQITKTGAIVLLSDFGDTHFLSQLEGAIDMAGVHAGMNHPNTAKTQFWFVDACRQQPAIAKKFETLSGAITLDEPIGATETSPLFLAAGTGTQAYARVGGVTLFNEALLWALRGKSPTAQKRISTIGIFPSPPSSNIYPNMSKLWLLMKEQNNRLILPARSTKPLFMNAQIPLRSNCALI
ncbi:caspase family protein [Chloroflexota bacterium]|nr:caspase family protein [Chloroflexota bacterium]